MVFVPTASISDVPTTICRASCESGRDSGFDEAEYERRDGAANAVQPGNDVVVSSSALRAQRLVLAGAIPYFPDHAQDWKIEGVMDGGHFYGSVFGTKLLLNYVYTGDFNLSSISATTLDELFHLLRDFLELMSIANGNMPMLK